MTEEQPVQEQTQSVAEVPVAESVTEVTVDPIYKHKDGRIFTKSQLMTKMGLTDDRIKDGLAKGMITQVGDTDDPTQQFKHKDGRVLSMKDFADMGVSKERVGNGIELGMITPIEKKNSTPIPPPLQVSSKPPVATPDVSVAGASASTIQPTEAPVQAPAEVPAKAPIPAAPVATEPTEPTNIIDALLEAKNNINKKIVTTSTDAMGGVYNEELPDEEANKKGKATLDKLKSQNIDTEDLYNQISRLPKEVYDWHTTKPDGTVVYPYSKDNVFKMYKDEPVRFSQFVNNSTNRVALQKAVDAIPVEERQKQGISPIYISNEYNDLNKADDFNTWKTNNVERQKEIINTYIPDLQERKELLNRLEQNAAVNYSASNPAVIAEYKASPLKDKLDVDQYSALQVLKMFHPDAYNQDLAIINFDHQVQTEDKDGISFVQQAPNLAAPNKSETVESINIRKGKEKILKDLSEAGRNNAISNIRLENEKITKQLESLPPDQSAELINQYNTGAAELKKLTDRNAELKNQIDETLGDYKNPLIEEYNNNVSKANAISQGINGIVEKIKEISNSPAALLMQKYSDNIEKVKAIQNDAKNDDIKYPLLADQKYDELVKDYMGQSGYTAFEGGLGAMGGDLLKTGRTLLEGSLAGKMQQGLAAITGQEYDPFGDVRRRARAIGETQTTEADFYRPPNEQKQEPLFINKFDKPLADKLDAVIKGRSLRDLSAAEKSILQGIIKDNAAQVHTVTNPNFGKTKNFASISTVYDNVHAIGTIVSFAIQAGILKGAGMGSAMASAIPLYTTSKQDFYKEGVQKGMANPDEYANVHATIMFLAGFVSPRLDVLKKMVGLGSETGALLNGISEKTWNTVINKNAGLINRISNSASNVASSTAHMVGVFGAGTSIASNLANIGIYSESKSLTQVLDEAYESSKHMVSDMAALTALGAVTNFKSTPIEQKARLWELGNNAKLNLDRVDEALANKTITTQEAEDRKRIIKEVNDIIVNMPNKNTKGGLMTDEQRLNYFYGLLLKNKIKKEQTVLPEAQKEKLDYIMMVADHLNDLIVDPRQQKQLEKRKAKLEKMLASQQDKYRKTPELNPKEELNAKAELEAINTHLQDQANKLVPTQTPEAILSGVVAPVVTTTEAAQPAIIADVTVSEVLNKAGSYKGEKGSFYQDGQRVIFQVEGTNKEYDLGNIEEIKDTPINQFGIEHEESIVSVNDAGVVKVRDESFINGYSDPLQAINRDADGKAISVTLDTPDGKKRTFRGDIAQDIAYQITLKQITKDAATTTEFEQFINEPDQQQQINTATIPAVTAEGTATANEPVQREPLQPTVPATTEPTIEAIDQQEVIKQMKPITDKMVEIEREFQNQGFTIDTDYDNEISVTDKDGELMESNDLPKELRKLAGDYEAITAKLGEFDDAAREKALAESRKVVETEAEVVETKQAELPKQESILTSKTDLKGGAEVEFKTPQQNTIKGIKVEIPGLEGLDTILVQDGMNYEVYELATGLKLADTNNAFSPAEAVKNIADNIPDGLQDKLLKKMQEGEEASRYRIAGEKQGITIINDSPAFNAYKEQKIAEAENKPYIHDEKTRSELLKMAELARVDGYSGAAETIENIANKRTGTTRDLITIEQAQKRIEEYKRKLDLVNRKLQNIPYPEADKVNRDPSEQALINAIQEGYKRDRWDKLPDDIKNAALEAWRKETAIYNKYGYYPASFSGGEGFFGVMLTLGKYIGSGLSKDPAKREARVKEDLQIMKDNFKRIDEIYKQEGFDVLKAPEGQTAKPLTITEPEIPVEAQNAFNRIKNRQKQAPKEEEKDLVKEEKKVDKTLNNLSKNFYKISASWPTGSADGVVIINNKLTHGIISILAKVNKGQSKEAFIDSVKLWGKNNGLEFTDITYDDVEKTERINFAPFDAEGKKFQKEEVSDVDYDQTRTMFSKMFNYYNEFKKGNPLSYVGEGYEYAAKKMIENEGISKEMADYLEDQIQYMGQGYVESVGKFKTFGKAGDLVKNIKSLSSTEAELPQQKGVGVEEMNVSNAVVDFPTNQIKTNIEEYQGRKTLFSERSAKNVAENFDRNKFDPIVIYKHPDGNTYVLSGHSRFEGMTRRGEPTIPARIFEGTPEEAKDFALKSNKLGTLQTDIENAAYYREQLSKGKSYSAVMSEAKENEQSGSAKRIVSYAHLNPKGKMMNALAALEGTEGDSSSNLSAIATKIGDIRASNPHLTDAHENELYDFMVSDKNKIPTDKELQDANSLINRSIAAARFDNTAPLNLKKTIVKSAERQVWEKEKEDLETQIREYRKEVNANKTTNWSGLKEKAIASLAKNKSQEAIDKALQDFNSDVNGIKTQYEKILAQKKLELKSLEDKLAKHLLREKGLIEGEKNQQTLFSVEKTETDENQKDLLDGVTYLLNKRPEYTLQQIHSMAVDLLKGTEGIDVNSPAFKKQVEQAYNDAKNNATSTIVKSVVLQSINKGFLKIGTTIFDNAKQLMDKAKQLSGSRFNAIDDTAGFETRDGKPLGFKYDTDQVARERFDFSKLKKIGEGSDRIVFDLGNGKVLKVAKTARGLEQNIHEGDRYLTIIPEVFERGLNYVVTENINRIKGSDVVPIHDPETGQEIGTATAGQMLRELGRFHQRDFERREQGLQDALAKYGLEDVTSYDLLYGDFTASRNWGYKDGKPYLIDAGTLGGVEMLDRYKGVKNLSDPDFRKIYTESKNLKKEYADSDKYTKFHYGEDGEILGFTHGGQIYLNGEKITAKTTMEEAGHIWINHTKETNPSLYNAGLKKVLQSKYLSEVSNSSFYKKEALKQGKVGSVEYNNYMQEEALAKAIADEGAKFVTDAQRIDFKQWVTEMWNTVKKAFGIRDLTAEQVAKLSLKDFAKMAAADVFSEKETAPTEAPKVEPTITPEGETVTKETTISVPSKYDPELGTEERRRGLYAHLMDAENVSQETKDFLKKNGIMYEVSNNAQAEIMAEDILNSLGKRAALDIARGVDVSASVRSAIYAKSIDAAYTREINAKTPAEKIAAAQEWKDLVTEYAEKLTEGGKFTAYAAHAYKVSPMGFVMKENADRTERFNDFMKGKEATYDELWKEINATAEGQAVVEKEVEKLRAAERAADRAKRDKQIDDFFDKIKINPKNTYSFIIPLSVLNPVIDGMKLAVKAGDRIADIVQRAIEQISDKVGDKWDKEAFRKDYENALTRIADEGKKEKVIKNTATELEKRIEGLEKQIADLKSKVASGGEVGKPKEIKFSDNPEVQALIKERDALRKENEDLLKDAKVGKYSDAAKIEAAKQRVIDAIAETQRKIDANDLAIKRKVSPTDADLIAHREQQKKLRKELEDMRKTAQQGKYSPQEIAIAEAKRKQARIDELNRRVNEMDFSAEEYKTRKAKDALQLQLDQAKKAYDESKKQSPEWQKKKAQQFLDKFRDRMNGLTDSQRNEIVARSIKKLAETGALDYADFRKIVAESMGLKDLTAAEVTEIEGLVQTINSVDAAEDALVSNPTDANFRALEKARQDAMTAGLTLYNKTHRESDIPRTFASTITGSLLSAITLQMNVVQNIVMQATVRAPKAILVHGTEQLLYGISVLGNKTIGTRLFEPKTNFLMAQKGYFKGVQKGLARGWFNFYKGTQEKELFGKTSWQSTLAPREAVRDLKMHFNKQKFLTKTELAERTMRATLGWQPDFILRAMGFGDRPFRWGAEGAAGIQIAKLELKLATDQEVYAFMAAPKKFAFATLIGQGVERGEALKIAEEMEQRILDAGSKAVLEQENVLSRISKWMDQGLATKKTDTYLRKTVMGAFAIGKTATWPFIKIPANVYWQMFKIANPEIALLQGVYHGGMAWYEGFKTGDKAAAKRQLENSKDNIATAVLGFGVSIAISGLVANGYVRPENDDETKAREREGEKPYAKGNQLNWGRLMGGGDYWIDLKWFGPIGTAMGVQATVQEQKRKDMLKGKPVDSSWSAGFSDRFSVAEMASLNNLVFDQAGRTIGAIKGGEYDMKAFAINGMNTGMNMITGATYVAISKAMLPEVPRLQAEIVMDEFKNNQLQRNLLYRMYKGVQPPSKVSIWGDPIKQDVSFAGVCSNILGFQESDANQFGAILFNDAQRTGDMRFFPTPVTDKVTVDGEEKKLTADQKSELAMYIGKSRKMLVSSFVYDCAFPYAIPVKGDKGKELKYSDKDFTDANKIHVLEMIYNFGRELGWVQFQQAHKEFAPAVLTTSQIVEEGKREAYDMIFKATGLEKVARDKGKQLPPLTKEEELQNELDKTKNQLDSLQNENNGNQ